jgi:hypothetical protein
VVVAACPFIESQSLVDDGAFFLILQWLRLGVSSCVHLGGAGVGRLPLTTVVAGNPKDRFVFLGIFGFYLQI